MTPAEMTAEIELLRKLKVGMEIRLQLMARSLVESQCRELVCRKCEALEEQLKAHQASADRWDAERSALVARLLAANQRTVAEVAKRLGGP